MSQSNGNGRKDKSQTPDPIAIIGIGCLLPEAEDLAAYWANIKNGVDAIKEVPESHWRPADYFDADAKKPDHTYGQCGGFLPSVDFDPLAFGMPPNALEATDTSQLLGMLVAERALQDAGYGTDIEFDRDRVGVILGVTGALELVGPLNARLGHPKWRRALEDAGVSSAQAEDVIERIAESYVPWQENSFPGLLGNVVAGRITKHLDLGGTNCVVDAACASSLSAVHLAMMELSAGRADMVVTGGVDTYNDIFMYMCFSKTPALSPGGHAKPFDANGDGTTLGEGLGIVVLKRLADAERDGDDVYAVIRSVGSSSDGKGEAIYAPSASGQARALRQAYDLAGISPETVGLVEAHGTGTIAGDAAEVLALQEVYGASDSGPWCALGSVKSQIGHTKACAGSAGLIKAALALRHKILPPTIKVTKPQEILTQDGSALYVNTEKRPWLAHPEHPRRAAVSALGFGGSNFHCILEEYAPKKTQADWEGNVELLLFSGDTRDAIVEALDGCAKLQDWTAVQRRAAELRDAFSVGSACRMTMVVEQSGEDFSSRFTQAKELLAKQEDAARWEAPSGIYFGSGDTPGKLGFLFPGQGSQSVGMLRDLSCQFPEMLGAFETANAIFESGGDGAVALSDLVYPIPVFDKAHKKANDERLRATEHAQPALGAVSAGALALLQTFGVTPDSVAGHSYGELVALYAAGRIDLQGLCRLSVLRGQLMAAGEGDRGSMLAVRGTVADVAALLVEHGLPLTIANKNAPTQVVLSGATEDIERAKKLFAEQKIKSIVLPVAAAFHSAFVAEASGPLLAALESMPIQAGTCAVYANTTAAVYPDDAEGACKLLAEQLAKPVAFVDEIAAMHAAGVTTFVEVGPGARLTGLVKAILDDKEFHALAMDSSAGKRQGVVDLGRVLAQLAALGYDVNTGIWNEGIAVPEVATDGKKPRLTVPITGANYMQPRPKKAPTPQAPPVQHATTAPAAASMAMPTQSAPRPVAPLSATPAAGGDAVSDALRNTQESMRVLQQMQEQTARLHQQYLEGQQAAVESFKVLLAQQQQLLSGGVAPAAIQPIAPPTPAAYVPAPEAIAVPSVPAPAAAPAIAEGSASDVVVEVLLATIAEKTGYPVEMLELDMSLDADLGIDSIKRVEIMSALQEELPNAPAIESQHLGELHTLRKIVAHLGSGASADAAHAPTSDSGGGGDTQEIERILLATLSEKTGYPAEMLELDMSLDADLGIDSIKRVEIMSALQEELPDAPAIESKHLGELHTLRKIVAHLASGVPAPAAAAPTTSQTDTQEIERVLLATLSEKTGYPAEMLGLDMSLDADLGIDSIKRVEILSALQEQLPDSPAIESKHLGELHSLRQIAEHLASGATAAPVETIPVVTEEVEATTQTRDEGVARLLLQAVDCPLSGNGSHPTIPVPKDAPIWITDDGTALTQALEASLTAQGFTANVVSLEKVSTMQRPGRVGGLVILAPPKDVDDDFLRTAFELMQFVGPALRAVSKESHAIFATISRMDGAFGVSGEEVAFEAVAGGLAGLSKTASHEWAEVHCKAIDLDIRYTDSAQAAKILGREVIIEGPLEVGISPDVRRTIELTSAPITEAASEAALNEGDVVIITGGARGVTAEVAHAIAGAYRPTLVLLGRSPLPGAEPGWFHGLTSEAEIKRALMERGGSSATPKSVQEEFAAISSAREVRENIARLERAGATVRYHAADICDAKKLATLISEVRQELGGIHGVIHGAGVLADRLIADKTAEQFDTVYGTKVSGLRSLLAAVEEDALKVLVLFSSSTGRFGRTGQIDYAVANEVLNKMAQCAAKERAHCRVVSVNWGPWNGGMVTPGLAKVFEEEGVPLIEKSAGAAYLVEELNSVPAAGAVEVVIFGGVYEEETPVKTVAAAKPDAAVDLPLAFELNVDAKSSSYLQSHVLNGKAVLPAAMMMEWLAQGALQQNPGLKFSGLDDFRVLKGVILEEHTAYDVRVLAGKATRDGNAFRVTAELRGVAADATEKLHASAMIVLADTLGQGVLPDFAEEALRADALASDAFYEDGRLFHGADLQSLSDVQYTSTTVAGLAKTAPIPSEWSSAMPRPKWVSDPLAVDSVFQLMILWSFEAHGVGSLPNRVGAYRQYVPEFPTHGVRIAVQVTDARKRSATANVAFIDSKTNTIVAVIKDYKCTMDASLAAAFSRNTLGAPTVG